MEAIDHPLIDIGANLTNRVFSTDLSQVIERARSSGLSHIVITGTNIDHSIAASQLAESQAQFLSSTCGVHPHHAKDWNKQSITQLQQLSGLKHVKAIGECGLDYNRNYSEPVQQRVCFEQQLELASECQLPVFLHQRDAHEDFIRILERWRPHISGGVAHCFTGNVEQARAYIDLGLKIGVTGWICDDRRGGSLREAIKQVPIEHIMIETDAPYLMPRDLPYELSMQLSKNRNEPMVLPHVCKTLAIYKDMAISDVAETTSRVSNKFFDLGA